MLIYVLNFLLGISVFSFKNTLEISNREWGGFLVVLVLFKRHKSLALNGLVFLLGFAWKLQLKRNNGYQNLGGFDYEQWLLHETMLSTLSVINPTHTIT